MQCKAKTIKVFSTLSELTMKTINTIATLAFFLSGCFRAHSFVSPVSQSSLSRPVALLTVKHNRNTIARHGATKLSMAQITEAEAKKGIEKVVAALRKDKQANEELGKLTKVQNILGFGSPRAGIVAVRFNASFQKGGKGMSSVPLPFGLGQSDKSEGRGTMVGQVKASLDQANGKLVECSVFRDLGYGRAFNLKCK